MIGGELGVPAQEELAARWNEQLALEAAVSAIGAGRDPDAIALAPRLRSRPVVLELVRAGADVNAGVDVTRATPLHMAERRGHVEIARALLDCGASINARDRRGDTPLQRAINCRRDAIVQLREERGAERGRSSR